MNIEDVKVEVWVYHEFAGFGQIITSTGPNSGTQISFDVKFVDGFIGSAYWDIDLKHFRLLTDAEKLELL